MARIIARSQLKRVRCGDGCHRSPRVGSRRVLPGAAAPVVHEPAVVGSGLGRTKLQVPETLHVDAVQQEDVRVEGRVGHGYTPEHSVHRFAEIFEIPVRQHHLCDVVGRPAYDEASDYHKRHAEGLDLSAVERGGSLVAGQLDLPRLEALPFRRAAVGSFPGDLQENTDIANA